MAEYTLVSSPRRNVPANEVYEHGNWTPTLTCAGVGNLSVSYAAGGRKGRWVRYGPLVHLEFYIETSTFTHTTASGVVQITGIPFSSSVFGNYFITEGSLSFNGITKATYTQFTTTIQPFWSSSVGGLITLQASGSGVSWTNVLITDMPTGGTVILRGQVTYIDQ